MTHGECKWPHGDGTSPPGLARLPPSDHSFRLTFVQESRGPLTRPRLEWSFANGDCDTKPARNPPPSRIASQGKGGETRPPAIETFPRRIAVLPQSGGNGPREGKPCNSTGLCCPRRGECCPLMGECRNRQGNHFPRAELVMPPRGDVSQSRGGMSPPRALCLNPKGLRAVRGDRNAKRRGQRGPL